jgi:polyisoprenoid-binding protein YceI
MAWQIDTAHTSVEFSVRHMAITTVRGRFEKFSGTVEVGPDGGLAGLEATVESATPT